MNYYIDIHRDYSNSENPNLNLKRYSFMDVVRVCGRNGTVLDEGGGISQIN